MVRAKENLNLNHGGPSYSQASGTNPPIEALRQSRHLAIHRKRLLGLHMPVVR